MRALYFEGKNNLSNHLHILFLKTTKTINESRKNVELERLFVQDFKVKTIFALKSGQALLFNL